MANTFKLTKPQIELLRALGEPGSWLAQRYFKAINMTINTTSPTIIIYNLVKLNQSGMEEWNASVQVHKPTVSIVGGV